jgi:GntR family transcriptional regulator/MocR family aminotransferase
MTRNEQPKSIDPADLPLSLDAGQAMAGYLQLANQLQALIDSGALRVGTRLPATRELARTVGINRNTVVAAFERLAGLGLIDTRGRGGSVVAARSRQIDERRGRVGKPKAGDAAMRPANRERPINFRLGSADPSPLPLKVWRRACRDCGRYLPGADYGDPQGDVELRTQIALYLGRTSLPYVPIIARELGRMWTSMACGMA